MPPLTFVNIFCNFAMQTEGNFRGNYITDMLWKNVS